jgi:hypothetical protein
MRERSSMIKDIFFVLMVLSVGIYAHSNKHEIISFIDLNEEEYTADGSLVVMDD